MPAPILSASRLWAQTARGQKLTQLELAEVCRALPDFFGRHCLQLGEWGSGQDWLAAGRMPHRAVLGLGTQGLGQAQVEAQRLPLPSKSIDALLLPHTLEAVSDPHALLREVGRVLSDRGRLLLLGFNPYSLLNLRRLAGMAPRNLPSHAHYYAAGRVSDWLALLDFEVLDLRRLGTGFPWQPPRSELAPFTPAALLSPFAETYCVLARKRIAPPSLRGRLSPVESRTLIPITSPIAAAGRLRRENLSENK